MSSTETDASAMSNKTLGSKLDDLSHGKRKAEVSQGKAPSMIQYGYAFQTEAKIQIKPTEAIAFVCSAIVTSLGIASTMEFGGIVGGTVVGIGIFMVIVIATIILERRDNKRRTVMISDIYTRYIDTRRWRMPALMK